MLMKNQLLLFLPLTQYEMYMCRTMLKLHGSSEGKLHGFEGFHSLDKYWCIFKVWQSVVNFVDNFLF
jgi:hypothetical protein